MLKFTVSLHIWWELNCVSYIVFFYILTYNVGALSLFSVWHWYIIVTLADGPAEDLYGMFINRVRRERPPEFLEEIKGWVSNSSCSPVSMPLICILAVSAVSTWFWLSCAGLQSGYHHRLRWQEVMSRITSTDPGRGWMLLRWTCCSSTGMFTHKVTITVIYLGATLCVFNATSDFVGQFYQICSYPHHPKKTIHKSVL